MKPEHISALFASVIASIIGVERGLRWLSDRRKTVPVEHDALQRISHATEKISETLLEMRADHRVQERLMTEISAEVRSIRT